VAPRLKLDRGADLFDRKACRDRHPEPTRRNQAGDLLDGARGCVGAVRRRDPVNLGGNARDSEGGSGAVVDGG
jgi:hypothetical protein